MADSILLALGVWLAVQLPLALVIGAILRRGRGPEAAGCDANPDIRPIQAA